MAWKNFSKTLGSNEAEPLSDISAPYKIAIIQAQRANDHAIYLGGADVAADNGLELINISGANTPLDKVVLESGYGSGGNLGSLYVIGTSGEGVQGMYEEF